MIARTVSLDEERKARAEHAAKLRSIQARIDAGDRVIAIMLQLKEELSRERRALHSGDVA